jgi:alkanesulfonate monooxygenase SsuD/methylene tetrahydromethanopterin reductase-like flavin-dependent oxidoreductase (luciferase family)
MMKLGAVFPQAEIRNDAVAIKDFVQAVEDLGYDYLSAYESVTGASPLQSGRWKSHYEAAYAWHAPRILFGYWAGSTHKLKLSTSIWAFPSRQMLSVAMQVAEMDALSGGRLRLGIAAGWVSSAYPVVDPNADIEEQIAILRALWTKPLVTFIGQQHTIDAHGINLLPVQRPIPIWISGATDADLRRVARLGDGWFAPTLPIPQARALVGKLHTCLKEAGREPGDIRIRCRVEMAMSYVWPEYVQLWRELGATHIELGTTGADLKTPQEHIEALRRFKTKIGHVN